MFLLKRPKWCLILSLPPHNGLLSTVAYGVRSVSSLWFFFCFDNSWKCRWILKNSMNLENVDKSWKREKSWKTWKKLENAKNLFKNTKNLEKRGKNLKNAKNLEKRDKTWKTRKILKKISKNLEKREKAFWPRTRGYCW